MSPPRSTDRRSRPATASGPAPERALAAALRQLARRPRTRAEVSRYLSVRGHDEASIDAALDRLSQMGYLDDAAYAARYAEWSAASRSMGRRRIDAELAKRGVPRAIVERAVGAARGPEVEAEALARALQRAARGVTGAPGPADRRRVAAFLMRRGFGAAEVLEAIERWAGGEGVGASDPDACQGEEHDS